MIKFAIIAESDMFGEDKKKRRKRRQPASEGERIRSFKELSVGDYVVHEGHGVGIYRGIENVEVDGVAKDYIKIEYGGGGSLYILATNLDMIQKYADKDTKQVKVNKMSGPEWTRTKTKVKGAVRELAMDLVKLYAARPALRSSSVFFCSAFVLNLERSPIFTGRSQSRTGGYCYWHTSSSVERCRV